MAKNGRFGPYVTEVLPDDAPKTAQAAHRLAVQVDVPGDGDPRRRGEAAVAPTSSRDRRRGRRDHRPERSLRPLPEEGHRLPLAHLGGPALQITLDEALAIYAQPKQRGRAAAAPPLKELGEDPESGQPVVVKAGRFGEYVTDGEYNATLRKDDSVEAITLERAAELLAERRARGPAKKAAKRTKTAKKAAAKKTTPRRRRRRRPRPRRASRVVVSCRPTGRGRTTARARQAR